MFMTAFITVVAAFLMGSVNFAVIFSKLFMHKDIRNIGSGNAGTTNVMRAGGFVPGALTFVCDFLKGFFASGLGLLIFRYISENAGSANSVYDPKLGAFICGIFCMLGHVFPVFFNFKGGKGVATGAGIMFVCSPKSAIIGLCVFALALVISKYVSLSSIVATVVTVISTIVLSFGEEETMVLPKIIFTLLMGIIICLKHSSNIKRLINGEERKIGRK